VDHLGPLAVEVLVEGVGHLIDVQRVTVQRVNGRELALVRALAGQAQECADDLECGLGDGLLEVAAGRGDRADERDGAVGVVVELDQAGALVEAGDAALEIGREGLFTGDLLEAAGHLAHGLGPAGGGVGQHQDVEAHLPVVFFRNKIYFPEAIAIPWLQAFAKPVFSLLK